MRGTVAILTGLGPACDGLSEWIERHVDLSQIQVRRCPGNQIPWQRNYLIQQLRQDDEFLLFVDADCIPPSHTIPRLFSHGVGVVGSLIIERRAPFNICALRSLEPYAPYRVEDFPIAERDIKPVVSVGTGCMMIRRAVFDAIPRPWFRCGKIQGGEDLLAEDLDFCLKAAQVGFPVYLDPGVRVGHETKVTLWPGDAEIMAQFDSHVGPLPYRVPLPVEELRELYV